MTDAWLAKRRQTLEYRRTHRTDGKTIHEATTEPTDPVERLKYAIGYHWAPEYPDADRSFIDQAACKGLDVNIFYPEQGGDPTEPKAICAGCPVRAECAQHAIDTNERFGTWGGYSRRQRLQLAATGKVDDRPRARPGRLLLPIKHGTSGGYQAHVRRRIPLCDECVEARNADQRARRAAKRDDAKRAS